VALVQVLEPKAIEHQYHDSLLRSLGQSRRTEEQSTGCKKLAAIHVVIRSEAFPTQ
jgi:hypothetical protein